MNKGASILILAVFAFILSSCAGFGASLMPSKVEVIKGQWQDYDAVEIFFNNIEPYKTTKTALKERGLDLKKSPNVRELSYLDIEKMFLTNQSIKIEDLPAGVQDCLKNRSACLGYEIGQQDIRTKGRDNIVLRWLKCKKVDAVKGWEAKFYLFTKNELIVDKVWGGGMPNVDKLTTEKKPLCLLQEPVDFLMKYNPTP